MALIPWEWLFTGCPLSLVTEKAVFCTMLPMAKTEVKMYPQVYNAAKVVY
jgi:hypothetical protein